MSCIIFFFFKFVGIIHFDYVWFSCYLDTVCFNIYIYRQRHHLMGIEWIVWTFQWHVIFGLIAKIHDNKIIYCFDGRLFFPFFFLCWENDGRLEWEHCNKRTTGKPFLLNIKRKEKGHFGLGPTSSTIRFTKTQTVYRLLDFMEDYGVVPFDKAVISFT